MSNERVTAEQRRIVIDRAQGCCEYCGSKAYFSMQSLFVDHVVPKVKGGETIVDNLALSCQGCNNHKYNKTEARDPLSGEMVPQILPSLIEANKFCQVTNMPTYDYDCTECGHTFEQFQSITAAPLETCPQCGGKVQRRINGGAGLIFKGSGFYLTDYKRAPAGAGNNRNAAANKDGKDHTATATKDGGDAAKKESSGTPEGSEKKEKSTTE